MIRFIFRRFLQTIPVLLTVATLTFFLLRLAPGGPFDDEKVVSKEILAAINEHYGLDKPLLTQYFEYMGGLIKGDLGPSFKYPNRTVNELIAEAFPVSMELGFYSIMVALMLGLGIGLIASIRPNTVTDYVPSSLAMTGICLPTFV